MATSKAVMPRQVETEGAAGLSKGQKVVGILLLLFYLAMIGVTIATLPYVANVESITVFERASGDFDCCARAEAATPPRRRVRPAIPAVRW